MAHCGLGRAHELARKRQRIDLDVYGECRDSERPKDANLSAWLIASVGGAHELARKRLKNQQLPNRALSNKIGK